VRESFDAATIAPFARRSERIAVDARRFRFCGTVSGASGEPELMDNPYMNDEPVRKVWRKGSSKDGGQHVVLPESVSIRMARTETVGEMSNAYAHRKRRSARRFEIAGLVASVLGSFAAAGVLSASQSLLEGGGSALIAAATALSALGLGIAGWSVVRKAQDTRTPSAPLPPGLASLGKRLQVMRQPLLDRSSLQPRPSQGKRGHQ